MRLERGGQIDRSRSINFRWGGRLYRGHPGDTLASALMANGITLLARSFKYHRPRGLLAAGVEEPNVLVQLGEGARTTPNVRATEVELYEGLVATPVNCWPSAGFDIGAINDRLARFFTAGFYYKTFMWPSWHVYEGIIRRFAGLGKAPPAADPDRYVERSAHCETLVVGGGVTGIAAALAAARGGERVLLVEQDTALGGSLLGNDGDVEGLPTQDWLREAALALNAAGVRVLLRTTATGYFDHNALTLLERTGSEEACAADPRLPRRRTWSVRAGRVILATGALERPIAFAGNDRPGIMLASAMRTYLRRFAAIPGRAAIIITNNNDAYKTAEALAAAGSKVVALIDTRSEVPAECRIRLEAHGIPLHSGAVISGTRGYRRVAGAMIRCEDGREHWLACDCIAMSGGFDPSVHLFTQSGGKLHYDEQLGAFLPGLGPQPTVCVGAVAGQFDLTAALANARAAGSGAANQPPPPAYANLRLEPVWQIPGNGKAFVDFQNDVTVADIEQSARESFRSVEHLKRYTTLGMAPDQGKTSNVNALAIMAQTTGRTIAETGTTRFRFPYTPMPISSFAGTYRGELFRPFRHMPGHDRHIAAGAVFDEFGGYLRPTGYRRAAESAAETERREALAVRQGAGLFESSPLGKIEVAGGDAARFLDLIYANRMSNLAVGKIRYGLMLNELGVIIDDGVTARLAEDRFLVSTTSTGADRIAAWLEEWLQCEWPNLDVVVLPVTSSWGVLTLTGPKARRILERIETSLDLSAEGFPHMHIREGVIAGIGVRVQRVSFTGEISFEIACPSARLCDLWDALFAAGREFGLVPVGIDAWMVLRTEKGYLHVGGDTDGTTTPLDVGWGHILRKGSDFVGRRSLTLEQNARPDRLQLVGIARPDGAQLQVGSHCLASDGTSEGYVTSSCYSPILERNVALGMIRRGSERIGEEIAIYSGGALRRAIIAPLCSFDPQGERLHG